MRRYPPAAWLAVLAFCAVCGWYAFGESTRVPLLGHVDFGFHELGHMIMYIFPISELLTAAMGSLMQIAVPLGLAAYFWFGRHDPLGMTACAAWAATSMQDASVYIADAPYERLELVGGEHDWAYILGSEQLNRLDQADTIAAVVRGAGAVLLLATIAFALYRLYVDSSTRRSTPVVPSAASTFDILPNSHSISTFRAHDDHN